MLRAAADLIHEQGVGGFSIDEVARRSGVAKTTIYRHFPDRYDLLHQALDGTIVTPETPDTGTLREDLLTFLPEVLPIFADRALRQIFLDMLAGSSRDPQLIDLSLAVARGRSGPLRTIVGRARERGEIDPAIDYLTAFDIIEGPLVVRSMLWPDRLDDYDIVSHVDRALRALAPGTAEPQPAVQDEGADSSSSA